MVRGGDSIKCTDMPSSKQVNLVAKVTLLQYRHLNTANRQRDFRLVLQTLIITVYASGFLYLM